MSPGPGTIPAPITPETGRIVHYVDFADSEPYCQAAIIVSVVPLKLRVFAANGHDFFVVEAPQDVTGNPGTWHPPERA